MPSYKNLMVPSAYVTQGTWDRMAPFRKLTFVTSHDLYCQVKYSSWDVFQATGVDEFTIPSGYTSKPFGQDVYGFRFRARIPGQIATVEFFTD